jgi:hypothetical protein
MIEGWGEFYVATGGAAAALTGLLFIAVSLRPSEIRDSPRMAGRARSAFYAFATITLQALLALFATRSRLIGFVQLAMAVGVLAISATFTIETHRRGHLHYGRALVYHGGLVVVAAGGACT